MIPSIGDRRWYCVACKANGEERAARLIEAAGAPAFVPKTQHRQRRRNRGGRRVIERIAVPGYLLVAGRDVGEVEAAIGKGGVVLGVLERRPISRRDLERFRELCAPARVEPLRSFTELGAVMESIGRGRREAA